MSGIGFELHRLLRDEQHKHRVSLARAIETRSSTPWLPPFVAISTVGILAITALGKGTALENAAALLISLVAASLIASAIPTAAIARIANDPSTPIVRPLLMANLVTTALSLLCLALLWHPLAVRLGLAPTTPPAALFVVLLANLWPPVVTLSMRESSCSVTVAMLLGLGAFVGSWFALPYFSAPGTLADVLCLAPMALIAVLLGYLLSSCATLDADAKLSDQRNSTGLDLATWSPAIFTFLVLIDRFLLGSAGKTPNDLLHGVTLALASLICTVPALWFFVKHLEPRLSRQRRELLNAIYEGESLLHIEQLLADFVSATQAGLMTTAKLLGISAIAGMLIAPNLLVALGVDPPALGQLQLAVISSAMLAQMLASISLQWLLHMRTQALAVTVLGLAVYATMAAAALYADVITTAVAAAVSASVVSIASLIVLRINLDSLEVDLLLR